MVDERVLRNFYRWAWHFVFRRKAVIFDSMSILVNTHNEQEEKVLLAFLNSLRFDYKTNVLEDEVAVQEKSVAQYNADIDAATAEIDAGNFVLHEDVEKLFADRRKALL